MRRLVIPKTLQIHGHTIKIKFKKLPEDCDGLWCYDTKEILLSPSLKKGEVSHLEQTFIHELTHCCLDHAGFDKESENEALVNALSQILHHAMLQIRSRGSV